MSAKEQEGITPVDSARASTPSTSGAMVIELPREEVFPLSVSHESVALRLTYTDRNGDLHRASLSTTGRLTDLYHCTEGVREFEARFVAALKLIGMNVVTMQPLTAASIELL